MEFQRCLLQLWPLTRTREMPPRGMASEAMGQASFCCDFTAPSVSGRRRFPSRQNSLRISYTKVEIIVGFWVLTLA